MSRATATVIAAAGLAALLAPGLASAQGEAADAGAPAEEADAGPEEAAPAPPPPEEPDLDEPFVPGAPPFDDAAQPAPPPAADLDDGKPFAKGDMEPGAGLGFLGYGDLFYMSIGGSFAYYVVNRLAPGLEVMYGTDFGSADIPDSVTLLPFLKFVILRNARFAPYLIALGGREFEFNGANAVHSWIVGGGAGVHIGFGEHVSMKIQITFQHHWYDDPLVRDYDDEHVVRDDEGQAYYCESGDCPVDDFDEEYIEDGTVFMCADAEAPTPDTCAQLLHDKKDLTHEWIFPIISFGVAFAF